METSYSIPRHPHFCDGENLSAHAMALVGRMLTSTNQKTL